MLQIEYKLLRCLQSWHNEVADAFFILVSNKWTWLPLYVVLLFFTFQFYKKQLPKILLYVLILIASADQLSVLIKNSVQRLRPCHNAEILNWLHMPTACGGSYGFVSSHSANSMALAIFFIWIFPRKTWLHLVMLAYTLLIGYSRIYVGAHYVGDVLGGYVLGMCLMCLLVWVNPQLGQYKLVLLQDEN